MHCATVHPDTYRLERLRDGRIIRLWLHGRKFGGGQEVVSNGTYAVPAGRVGLVEELREPYTEDRTTNVIGVMFDDEQFVVWMKPKNLMPEGVRHG